MTTVQLVLWLVALACTGVIIGIFITLLTMVEDDDPKSELREAELEALRASERLHRAAWQATHDLLTNASAPPDPDS